MTSPSDIAGLSERLRDIRFGDSVALACQLDDLCIEAATALDSLSARVKEADEACQHLCGAHGFATGHGDSVADMIDEISTQIGMLEERALRAEQQRDEAYERAAKVADGYCGVNFPPQYQHAEIIAAAIRRLASGPEGGEKP